MTITARETGRKSPADVAAAVADFTPLLRSGELLTGSPAVVETGGTSDLTISNVGLNDSTVSVNGSDCVANAGIQFLVAGGNTATKYVVKMSCGTDATPAQTLVRSGTFFCE